MEEELEEHLHKEIRSIEDALFDTEKQIGRSPELGKLDPFSFIGKVAIIIVVAVLLVAGGIYIGSRLSGGGTLPANNIPKITEFQE